MPRIRYERHDFKEATLATIVQAREIIDEYSAQGYSLTLRQVYYQFVSRGLLENKQTEYKRLGDIISKARRAGMIDWQAIVDRTRNLQQLPSWESPSDIVAAVAQQFRYDRWEHQPTYVEVWFEKDALMGVFERPANQLRLPFFSCRGYPSDSEVWAAAQRLEAKGAGRDKVVLHFGDHDPSGIDMTRDIRERLELFGAGFVEIRRLALNMDQVEEYQPPPNPAKESDSRIAGYREIHGDESWELDALEPRVLAQLVTDEVDTLIEREQWEEDVEREREARQELQMLSDNYEEIVRAAKKKHGLPDAPAGDEDEE